MHAPAVLSGLNGISTLEEEQKEGRRTQEGRPHSPEKVFSFESRLALARANISGGVRALTATQTGARWIQGTVMRSEDSST